MTSGPGLESFVSFLDYTPDPAIVSDAQDRIVVVNHSAESLFGYRQPELVGRSIRELVPALTVRRTDRTPQNELTTVLGRHRDGRTLSLAVSFRAVPLAHQELTASYFRQSGPRAAVPLEAANRFRHLTEGSQDLISEHDQAGTFLYASKAAVQLLGRSPESLIDRQLAEFVHDDDQPRVAEALAGASNGESGRLTTFRLVQPDGEHRWGEMTAQAEPSTGTIVCTTRDITERMRSEEILRTASRMEATATLAAGVAHDFNNLMTAILGNAELLLTDPSFPDSPSRLNQIAESAKRGGALAQQLLAYARGGKYQAQAVDLNEIVRQTLHLQRHAMPPRIQLEQDLTSESVSIEADPVQVGQVLTNLCINATEAIPGVGRVTIRTRALILSEEHVRGKPGLSPGRAVLLEVSDSGTGIEPAALPKIFEPFFSTKFQGRGLGLAAAYGIIKNHRGYIGVESAIGQGTTFCMYLPATSRTPTAPKQPIESFPTGDETILLVDDDEAVVDVTKSILERLNYRVLVAGHGIEAVEIARTYRGEIHLALLDMGMPLAGGAEAFPFLRAARPDMRILISSGYEMNEVVQGLLAAGASAFLQKPYRVSALARGIRRVLDRQVTASRLED
jgi:PAS domain S-box-containing protein